MLINDYRRMKNVERLGLETVQRSYNLLEHSYMVAMLFSYFAKKEEIEYDIEVFQMVLHHDILETITGDLSYTVKHLNAVTKLAWETIEEEMAAHTPRFNRYTDKRITAAMNPAQYELFKACDLLDLWIFVKEEIALGNGNEEILKVERTCVALVKGKFNSIDLFMSNWKFD